LLLLMGREREEERGERRERRERGTATVSL
jgi:hypothetical protein